MCKKNKTDDKKKKKERTNIPCRLKENDRFSFLVLYNVVKCLYIITRERHSSRGGGEEEEDEDDTIVTLSSFLLTMKEYTRK